MSKVVVLLLVVGCVKTTTHECETGTPNARICAATSICDDTHHLCVTQSQLDACSGLGAGATCSADTVPGLCRDGVCLPPTCGDGIATNGEECDDKDLGSASDCTSLQYYDPSPLGCKPDCTYDRTQCLGFCGDGLVDPRFEVCDAGPPAESCVDLGYGAGALGCRLCGPALESCRYFGWHKPVVTPHYMFDVSAYDDSHVYAVGAHGSVYRFDGNGWGPIDISSCFPTFDMSELDTVQVLAADDVWIGGEDFMTNSAIAVHVTKTGCVKLDVSSAPEVKQIYAVSDTDVYAAVGTSLFHYDGAAWTMADATAAQYVWASGPDDVYAAAYNGTSIRHRSGGTWQTESLPGSPTVASVWGRGANDVYVGGANGTGPYAASVLLHWTGGSWIDMSPRVNATTAIPTAVTSIGVANNRLFVVVPAISARALAYDGTTWTDLRMPTSGGISSKIAVTASGKIYAIEGLAFLHRYEGTATWKNTWSQGVVSRIIARAANDAYANDGSALLEVWDGSGWTQDTGTGNVSDLWVDPNGVVYVVGASGGLRKRTGTNTWANVDAAATGTRLWGAAGNDIWSINGTMHSLQHWNGSSTSVCSTCTIANTIKFNDLWGASSVDVFAIGDLGKIWRWDGASWTSMTSNTANRLTRIWGWAANDIVAIGDLGTVLHFDGATWSELGFPSKVFALTAVWGSALNDLFVATSGGEMFRYDGSRWSPVDVSDTGLGIDVLAGAGDTVFLFGGGVFKRLIRTISW